MNPATTKVLYVEDDTDMHGIARLSLEQLGGMELQICLNAAEALTLLESYDPDLILLDVIMPGMDGRELIQTLQDMQQAPVVFITAKNTPQDIEELKALGALDVLPKPFNPMTLAPTLEELLANAQKGQAQDELGDLFAAFAQALPEKYTQIESAWRGLLANWSQEDIEHTHRLVHSLTGSAAMYGYPEISETARSMEHLLREQLKQDQAPEGTPKEAIEQALVNLGATIPKP